MEDFLGRVRWVKKGSEERGVGGMAVGAVGGAWRGEKGCVRGEREVEVEEERG